MVVDGGVSGSTVNSKFIEEDTVFVVRIVS